MDFFRFILLLCLVLYIDVRISFGSEELFTNCSKARSISGSNVLFKVVSQSFSSKQRNHYSTAYAEFRKNSIYGNDRRSNSIKKGFLCLATTVMAKNITMKRLHHRNSIRNFHLLNNTTVVVYTNDSYWIQFCKDGGIPVETSFRVNPYGTPIFRSIMSTLEQNYDCSFYGYANGDILFHSTLPRILLSLSPRVMKDGQFRHWLLIGRRHNVDNITNEFYSSEEFDSVIKSSVTADNIHNKYAIDYFIFTRGTYKWKEIPDLVIGRIVYDNYLEHIASHDFWTYVVDLTAALDVVHQTDELGNMAGHRNQSDSDWNVKLVGPNTFCGTTDCVDYRLSANYTLCKTRFSKH